MEFYLERLAVDDPKLISLFKILKPKVQYM